VNRPARSSETPSSSPTAGCGPTRRRASAYTLREAAAPLRLAYLRATKDRLRERAGQRAGHFFPAALLDSQFAALEEPDETECALTVPADMPLPAILDHLGAAHRSAQWHAPEMPRA
jgi:gluconokinase